MSGPRHYRQLLSAPLPYGCNVAPRTPITAEEFEGLDIDAALNIHSTKNAGRKSLPNSLPSTRLG